MASQCTRGDTAASQGRQRSYRLRSPRATARRCRYPGPTLVVTEGTAGYCHPHQQPSCFCWKHVDSVPGFPVTASGGVAGILTQEAAPGATVTYTFTAASPGTRAYYSGTQGDLQIEMGLYGAIIVLPSSTNVSHLSVPQLGRRRQQCDESTLARAEQRGGFPVVPDRCRLSHSTKLLRP